MILKGSIDNSVVIVSGIKNKHGENIIISIQFNKQHKNHLINNISSAYGKGGFKEYMERQIGFRNILAVNKNKVNEMFQSLGLQLPPEETIINFSDNITYSIKDVK